MALLTNNGLATKAEFEAFIKQLLPKFRQAEAERQKIWKKWIGGAVIAGLVILCLLLINFEPGHIDKHPQEALQTILLLAVGVPALVVWMRVRYYVLQKKEKFMPELLKSLGLKGKQDVITKQFVRKSLLLDTLHYRDFDTDDSFAGEYCGTTFAVLEAVIKGDKSTQVQTNDSSLQALNLYMASRNKRHPDDVFRGIYIAVALDKPFQKRAMIYNTPSLIHKKQRGFEPVEIEDVEFMQSHQILAQDQIEIRYILTPAFIERLKQMRKVFYADRVDMAFFDSYALFQVHTNCNMFEPFSLTKKATDMNVYRQFYDEIESICRMIRVLNIDNRKQEEMLSKERQEKEALKQKRKQDRRAGKLIQTPIYPTEQTKPDYNASNDDDEEELLNTVL